MNMSRTIVVAMLAAALGATLVSCSRSKTSMDARGTSPRRSAVLRSETTQRSKATTKQELIDAALDEMHGRDRECVFRVFVSLNDLLATCPDIAEAALQEESRRSHLAMSLRESAAGEPLWSPESRTILATHGDVPLHSADCGRGFVELEDLVVHFSASERHYQVTLREPYLCNGEVYGHLDAPIWTDPTPG